MVSRKDAIIVVIVILVILAYFIVNFYDFLSKEDAYGKQLKNDIYNNWSDTFIQSKQNSIKEVLEDNGVKADDLEEGFLVLYDRLKKGGELRNNTRYLYNISLMQFCLRVMSENCKFHINDTACKYNTVAYCKGKTRLDVISNSITTLTLTEYITKTNERIKDTSLDSPSAKTLSVAFMMAISGIENTWLYTYLNERYADCLERLNMTAINDTDINNCVKSSIVKAEKILILAEQNMMFSDVVTSDCVQNVIPIIYENYRGYLISKIPATKIPLLKLTRIITYKSLDWCDKPIIAYGDSLGKCPKTNEVSEELIARDIKQMQDSFGDAKSITGVTDVAYVQGGCMTSKVSRELATLYKTSDR